MSGFASLLNQFKQTTDRAARKPSSSSSSQAIHSSVASSRKKSSITRHAPTTPIRRIFVACPLVETGGPEALHQLCHVVNSGSYQYQLSVEECAKNNSSGSVDELGSKQNGSEAASKKNTGRVKAYMLYLRESHNSLEVAEGSPRPAKYDLYDAPCANVLPGESDCDLIIGKDGYCSDLVVWPEIWTNFIDVLQPTNQNEPDKKAKKYQSAIWWLSVDNNRGAFAPKDFRERVDVMHLVQSAYARHYVHSNIYGGKHRQQQPLLMKKRAKVLDLTEFIPYAKSLSFADDSSQSTSARDEASDTKTTKPSTQQTRDLDVVYNPVKGMHYTDEIIRRAGNKRAKSGVDSAASGNSLLRFHPIGKGEGGRERISGDEVVALLRRAKVYIDFGHHPGMDRLPREATLAGCIVLTNREGAANFDKDVPLPKEFKFASFDVDKIHSMLKDCCCDDAKYKEYVKKMIPYRDWILGQEYRMRECVDKLIDEIVIKRSEKQNGLPSSEK